MSKKKSIAEETYDDWVELLKRANAMEFLKDPFAVWVEALHTGAILQLGQNAEVVDNYVNRAIEDPNATFTGAEVRQLLHQTIALIQAQGKCN